MYIYNVYAFVGAEVDLGWTGRGVRYSRREFEWRENVVKLERLGVGGY
jgi:hypothetical protein